MDLSMFYELNDAGSPVLDEHDLPVIRHRLESKALADVLLVTRLHAANPAMHHVIDKFIELYSVTLQWDWFVQYQAWLANKADAELNALALPIENQDQQAIEIPLFAEPEPFRPELKTIEQYRAEILIDGISIDEYLFRTQRTVAVNSIIVEVDGLVFDGDEQSQRRMLAAIHASEDAGIESTIWRLADNTEAAVTVEQIRQAHSLAIIEQGKLWTKGAADA
ncbi:DUF4376 domain-containing protein [Shewanella baltica]|uniref:DUF4376 domain-containing protein n=1 Tax=Shewanella baltica TaxID=62322 RepID=UPI00217E42FB|nr:DUF4376 domain-containing protein [Shewanella baltica]MCS6126693.1 DUF4376 domain-containing protein [Shewanella baltica]MCS6138766.1 DUF4376 domain-containing protein [Shewanella baltica]MCS6144955.1 DUF4376 domain-containing protein [Shewanella baltica]MCS6169485.1 DUF4376 domain-containing protein [Shewanella baltica]MCS6186709.1 DUF4376 domain-containing protein [Shewanella baltica]